MAERITIAGLYKQLTDFRAQFDQLALNYADHMQHEQPWMQKVDEALFGIDGDEDKPGLHRDVAEIKRYIRSGWTLFKWTAGTVIGAAITIGITSLVGCRATGELATAISQSNTQGAQTATAISTDISTLTATPPDIVRHNIPTGTPEPTITLTPWRPVTVTPRPSTTPVDHIIELNTDEVEWLSATCWIEGRGFGDRRVDLCASVVSTIMYRTRNHFDSDGTVRGTLTFRCTPESEWCAFPSWAVTGCEGIVPEVCPFYDTDGMIYFRGVVLGYLSGQFTAPCADFPFYDSRPDIPDGACLIEDGRGNTEVFHN